MNVGYKATKTRGYEDMNTKCGSRLLLLWMLQMCDNIVGMMPEHHVRLAHGVRVNPVGLVSLVENLSMFRLMRMLVVGVPTGRSCQYLV